MSAPSDSAITEIVPLDAVEERLNTLIAWAETTMLRFDVGLQVALVAAAIIPALIFGPQIGRLIRSRLTEGIRANLPQRLVTAAVALATPFALLLTLMLIRVGLGSLERPTAIVQAAISLMTAWLVIRAVTLVIRSKFWSAVAFYIAWPVAALDVFGLLDDVVTQMETFAVPLGETSEGEQVSLSLFDVLRTILYFGVLFWGASVVGRMLDRQLERAEDVSPAFRALVSKSLGVILPVLALLIALQLTGFNLATLAIFSGAVGIGVGLGLQRTVANFAAGFTLLADKSIKPGDAIDVDGTFGWVTSMQARYVSVRTRDGTELLLPNEYFIANGVINWSHSDDVIRLHAPFGVSYSTQDLSAVQALAVAAAKTVDRVVSDKEPVCNVMEFGDSSVNFDLRFWIRDPSNGLANVRSDVYLELWRRLHEAGVEIPFPQLDLHVKEAPGRLARAEAAGEADDAVRRSIT